MSAFFHIYTPFIPDSVLDLQFQKQDDRFILFRVNPLSPLTAIRDLYFVLFSTHPLIYKTCGLFSL